MFIKSIVGFGRGKLKGKKRFVSLAGKLKPKSRRLFTQPFIKWSNWNSAGIGAESVLQSLV